MGEAEAKAWRLRRRAVIAAAFLDDLRRAFREAGESRGWSFEWPERSGYAHGELAELVEAVRGKRGEVPDEGGDVLLTALCGLVPPDVPMVHVLDAAIDKVYRLATRRAGVDGSGASQGGRHG